MVSSNLAGTPWSMDTAGKIRMSIAAPAEHCRAEGWVDPKGTIGAVEKIDGEPAVIELLPTEVLDQLEARFPGTRWFVGDARCSAA